MKIAMAQMNSVLGDFSENTRNALKQIKKAKSEGADLVLFPECALFGYHPVDLLEKQNVVKNQLKHLDNLHKKLPEGIAVLIGAITENNGKNGKPYFNSAVFLQKSKPAKVFNKELLPTYDVFDEARHIEPGALEKNILSFKGKKFLITVCEDIWAWTLPGTKNSKYNTNPLKKVVKNKFDAILNLSASPFHDKKLAQRKVIVKKTTTYLKAPMFYTNLVGAQDELIFDGSSLVVNKKGEVVDKLSRFREDFKIYNLDEVSAKPPLKSKREVDIEERYKALVLGIRDFVNKIGFNSVHFGLSGGIDSAVVACLAAEALGANKVTSIGLPGPYNSPKSLDAAQQLAKNLGTKWHEIAIDEIYNSEVKALEGAFGELSFGLVHENLQARTRGLLLMAYSNLNSSLLINTSNKSELAMGYSTLYGDLCGGLSPLGDLTKTQVFELARYINKDNELIPNFIIERPPSAELRPNQKDEDSLPKYELLDKSVDKLVTQSKPPTSSVDKKVFSALMKTEFKRWQAPPILKVSDHAFGRGRRLPIAHRAT